MLLRNKVFPADFFDWSLKTPSCSASDLAALREGPFAAIYDDACDIGFVLVNPATGSESWWYVEKEHVDREGVLTHWTLKAAPESVRKHPRLKGYTLIVFND